MTRLAFVDCETTGLDPDRHEVWEVAVIVDDDGSDSPFEQVWQLPVDLSKADPMALEVGRFRDRYSVGGFTRRNDSTSHPDNDGLTSIERFVDEFALLTHGAHLVGAVVSFDAERLAKLLRKHGQCPSWHYHLVDVEALIAGRCRIEPPWSSRDLSLAVGIDPADYDRHTALGDARWARDLYYATLRS